MGKEREIAEGGSRERERERERERLNLVKWGSEEGGSNPTIGFSRYEFNNKLLMV